MLVSIIIPMYNCENYIEECIASLLNQTYKDIEIIVIDDGSIDNGKKIVKNLIQHNKNVRIFEQINKGAPAARNKGIELANGEFLMFLDADDYLYPNAIETMMHFHLYDLIIGSVDYVNSDKYFIQSYNLEDKCYDSIKDIRKLLELYPFPLNKLFKTEIIRMNNLKFSNVKIGQDLNFYIKFILSSCKIKVINSKVANYRIVEGSISRTYTNKIFEITKSYKDCLEFCYDNSLEKQITDEVSLEYLKHYGYQITKINLLKDTTREIALQKYNKAIFELKNNLSTECDRRKYIKVLFIVNLKKLLICLGFYKKKR